MDIKWCSRGKHNVGVDLFSTNKISKDGLFTWCKACMAAYEKERYHSGDRERKERNKAKTTERARDYLWSVLSGSVCPCGQTDPLTFEFDHRDPTEKEYNIAEMMNLSVSKIKKEVQKCDVLCASCHRRKTAIQFGFWKAFRDVNGVECDGPHETFGTF